MKQTISCYQCTLAIFTWCTVICFSNVLPGICCFFDFLGGNSGMNLSGGNLEMENREYILKFLSAYVLYVYL